MSSSTPRPSFSHRPLLGRTPSGMPSNPILRPILGPVIRLFHVLSLPVPAVPSRPPSPGKFAASAMLAFSAAVQRLDLSLSPRDSLERLAKHRWTFTNTLPLVFMGTCAAVNLYIMQSPGFPLKLLIPIAYFAALLVPLTSQFVLPATPVFAWLITFFSARFISPTYRPNIHVALLPALESVLYGANISDLQTRYTHPVLDILAWLPYGVLHFTLPFIVAFTLWVAGPKGGIQYWGRAFGFMNLLGVLTQLVLPCAAPWYEIIHGLTPADYSMPGSPGGLMRIDRVFHSQGYTNTFGHAPLVFGAFPSLHSGCAVMEALFLSHFFPSGKVIYWSYVGVLWWATMYLSHHYLIDLAGGACLSVLVFYLVMPEEFKDSDQIIWANGSGPTTRVAEGYEMVNERRSHEDELDLDEEIRKLEESGDEAEGEDDHAAEGSADAARREAARKKGRTVSWGETSVMGENSRHA